MTVKFWDGKTWLEKMMMMMMSPSLVSLSHLSLLSSIHPLLFPCKASDKKVMNDTLFNDEYDWAEMKELMRNFTVLSLMTEKSREAFVIVCHYYLLNTLRHLIVSISKAEAAIFSIQMFLPLLAFYFNPLTHQQQQHFPDWIWWCEGSKK